MCVGCEPLQLEGHLTKATHEAKQIKLISFYCEAAADTQHTYAVFPHLEYKVGHKSGHQSIILHLFALLVTRYYWVLTVSHQKIINLLIYRKGTSGNCVFISFKASHISCSHSHIHPISITSMYLFNISWFWNSTILIPWIKDKL